ncbi:MAG: DUF1559 domain-containing protein [Pirellulales bacterium]|nr:DUF1559 domain-containing protein [Pirellulales bacterium]
MKPNINRRTIHLRTNIHRSSFIVPRTAFTLVELLVVIAIIGIMVAMLLPGLQGSRELARRTACSNKLAQLSMAMHNYEMAHEVFPPGVTEAKGPIRNEAQGSHHNWIIQLLPYMEETSTFRNIDQNQSVYSGKNAPVMAMQLASVTCPTESNVPPPGVGGRPGITNYAGVHHDLESPIDADNHGLLFLNSRIRYHDITDGAKHTLLIGEKLSDIADLGWLSGTRASLRNTGSNLNCALPMQIAWSKIPNDPNPPSSEPAAPPDPTATNIVANPADVPAAESENPPAAVEKPQPLVPAIPENAPDPIAFVGGFNSMHAGGVNFVFADGSIKFLPETIDLSILQQLANRADGKLPPTDN